MALFGRKNNASGDALEPGVFIEQLMSSAPTPRLSGQEREEYKRSLLKLYFRAQGEELFSRMTDDSIREYMQAMKDNDGRIPPQIEADIFRKNKIVKSVVEKIAQDKFRTAYTTGKIKVEVGSPAPAPAQQAPRPAAKPAPAPKPAAAPVPAAKPAPAPSPVYNNQIPQANPFEQYSQEEIADMGIEYITTFVMELLEEAGKADLPDGKLEIEAEKISEMLTEKMFMEMLKHLPEAVVEKLEKDIDSGKQIDPGELVQEWMIKHRLPMDKIMETSFAEVRREYLLG